MGTARNPYRTAPGSDPLELAGRDAIREVSDIRFLQEFASAARRHHRGAAVTKFDVAARAPGVQRILDQSVYDRQFDQLTSREVTVALALHELGPGAQRPEEIAQVLGVTSSSTISSAGARLIKKDIIYVPARGLAEFRMPLANEYIERHKARLMKRAKLAAPQR